MSMKQTLNNWRQFLEKEAELGNPDAMSILSRMHRDGADEKTGQREDENFMVAPLFSSLVH
jgi:TPR repeat protein